MHDTVAHIECEGKKYVLTGDYTKTCLGLLNAFFLNNSLFGKRLQIFTDGHRALNASILKHFEWYENMQIVLDWYHLHKKFKEILSIAMKGFTPWQDLYGQTGNTHHTSHLQLLSKPHTNPSTFPISPWRGGVCHLPVFPRSHYDRGDESATNFAFSMALFRRGLD